MVIRRQRFPTPAKRRTLRTIETHSMRVTRHFVNWVRVGLGRQRFCKLSLCVDTVDSQHGGASRHRATNVENVLDSPARRQREREREREKVCAPSSPPSAVTSNQCGTAPRLGRKARRRRGRAGPGQSSSSASLPRVVLRAPGRRLLPLYRQCPARTRRWPVVAGVTVNPCASRAPCRMPLYPPARARSPQRGATRWLPSEHSPGVAAKAGT